MWQPDFFEPGLASAILFAAIWIGMGTVIALQPRQYHPPGALLLLTFLVVLLPYIWIEGHPFFAIAFALGVVSILRWPFYYIGRSIIRKFGVTIERDAVEKTF